MRLYLYYLCFLSSIIFCASKPLFDSTEGSDKWGHRLYVVHKIPSKTEESYNLANRAGQKIWNSNDHNNNGFGVLSSSSAFSTENYKTDDPTLEEYKQSSPFSNKDSSFEQDQYIPNKSYDFKDDDFFTSYDDNNNNNNHNNNNQNNVKNDDDNSENLKYESDDESEEKDDKNENDNDEKYDTEEKSDERNEEKADEKNDEKSDEKNDEKNGQSEEEYTSEGVNNKDDKHEDEEDK